MPDPYLPALALDPRTPSHRRAAILAEINRRVDEALEEAAGKRPRWNQGVVDMFDRPPKAKVRL
jgi:hypothetical protein